MFTIQRLTPDSAVLNEWEKMRLELWPALDPPANAKECRLILDQPERLPVFVALDAAGRAIGFAETQLREYAEGCDTSPVGYLEAWYVREDWRGRGVGRALLQAAENWARDQKMTEMASDAEIDNHLSELVHKALGFEESVRIVCFRKRLAGADLEVV